MQALQEETDVHKEVERRAGFVHFVSSGTEREESHIQLCCFLTEATCSEMCGGVRCVEGCGVGLRVLMVGLSLEKAHVKMCLEFSWSLGWSF